MGPLNNMGWVLILAVMLLFCLDTAFGQWYVRQERIPWAWVSGHNGTINVPVSYGQQGVSSPSNSPGSRRGSVGWFDATTRQGWVFGGEAYSEVSPSIWRNDLWRFDLTDSTWTWVGGTASGTPGNYGQLGQPSTANFPGPRSDAVSWYDSANGEAWIFGGIGNGESGWGQLNDLWRYRIADQTWTWMGGSKLVNAYATKSGAIGVFDANNYPGSRFGAISWFDASAGDAWVFGGEGFTEASSGKLNDVWKYHLSNNTWAWMGGGAAKFGVYGQQGVASATSSPGSRVAATSWFDDETRTAWVFGGTGYAATTTGSLNDLWKYFVDNNTWVWMSGERTYSFGNPHVGEYNSMTHPGSRLNAISWFDRTTGEAWIFGGDGYYTSMINTVERNDLWRYRISNNTWSDMAGSDNNLQALYGLIGVADTKNYPGSRSGALGWYDSATGDLWLFGGKNASSSATDWLFKASFPRCAKCWPNCPAGVDACAQGSECKNGLCLLSNGALATDKGRCSSGILSYYGHCCSTWCPHCNDCSSGDCVPKWEQTEPLCPIVDCVGKIGGWTDDSVCSECVANVTQQCADGFCARTCKTCQKSVVGRPKCRAANCQFACPVDIKATVYATNDSVCNTYLSGCEDLSSSFFFPGLITQAEVNVGGIVAGVIVAVVVVAAAVAGLLFWRARRNKRAQNEPANAIELDSSVLAVHKIKSSELMYENCLGEGSFGAVYKGKYRDQPVAIKKLHGMSSSGAGEFFREAQLMLSIPAHENIVRLIGICQQQNSFALVMELLDGGSLLGLIETKAAFLSEEIKRRICRGVAAGMASLAEQNIVHRDLAARNILLTSDWVPKVSDFGFSRVVGEDGSGKTQTATGPIRWMSPEALNMEFSEKSDVWSYGCLMVEVFTGKPPFDGLDIFRIGVLVRDEGHSPEVPASAPMWAQSIMTMCFQRNPNLRPTFVDIVNMIPNNNNYANL